MGQRPAHSTTAGAVRAELARRRITGRQLAKDLGWPRTNLGRRLAGETPFRVDELHAIAAHLGIPAATLLGDEVAA